MIRRKIKKKGVVATKDPQKEATFKSLVDRLLEKGYIVRREKLKRGLGWKVYSGACRSNEQRIIFVDQRLSQDEQISFVQEVIRSLGVIVE
jgi:hypothetical protein